jgi:hypothetical protein
MRRPLLVQNGLFFDDESSRFVDLAEILNTFLSVAPKIADLYDA